ncbi:MAG TPA: hypothetical protein VK066_08740 [Chloroflexota bacterium]|nr:hypothetical protein [Chloroflexota bacterium]
MNWHDRAGAAPRLILGALLALALAAGLAPAARAQGDACDRVRLVDMISNVDLVVRCPSGEVRRVRLAGLEAWPDGWPLADPDLNPITLSDRVANLVRGGPLTLGPVLGRTADGSEVREATLAGNRGSLAEWIVRQGWAQTGPDVDRVVPEAAATLRDAEAEARAARRGLWDVRDHMVSYTTPNGGEIQVDRRLLPALDLLGSLDIGRPLVNDLARAGVPVFMAPERPEVEAWAHFDPRARDIWVHTSLVGGDPRTVAVVLAHEATHSQDLLEGRIDGQRITTDAQAQACFDTEIHAFSNQLAIWSELFGDEGKTPELHRIERENNILLGDYGTTRDELYDFIHRLYRGECRVRE